MPTPRKIKVLQILLESIFILLVAVLVNMVIDFFWALEF